MVVTQGCRSVFKSARMQFQAAISNLQRTDTCSRPLELEGSTIRFVLVAYQSVLELLLTVESFYYTGEHLA